MSTTRTAVRIAQMIERGDMAELDREANRVARLLDAAEFRAGVSEDKSRGVQDRIAATCAKHRRTLERLENAIEANR